MNINKIIKLATLFEKISKEESWLPSKEWESSMDPREKLLVENNIQPIARIVGDIGGPFSSFLGEGLYSQVYEVEYKGKRAVAKITSSKEDFNSYKRIAEIYESAPKEVKKHLPKVYDIIDTKSKFIIITEYLLPLNTHLLETLFKPSKIKYSHLSLDSIINLIANKFVYYYENINNYLKLEELNNEEILKDIILNKEEIVYNISNYIFNLLKYNDNPEEGNNLEEIAMDYKNKVMKLIYDIIVKFNNDNKTKRKANKVIVKVEDLLSVDFKNFLNTSFPKSYLRQTTNPLDIEYYQELPESKSLIRALKYLKDNYNYKWQDVNKNNLMERPKTRDIVISDPGLFI